MDRLYLLAVGHLQREYDSFLAIAYSWLGRTVCMQGGIINVSWQEVLVDVCFVGGQFGAYLDKQLGICFARGTVFFFFFAISFFRAAINNCFCHRLIG